MRFVRFELRRWLFRVQMTLGLSEGLHLVHFEDLKVGVDVLKADLYFKMTITKSRQYGQSSLQIFIGHGSNLERQVLAHFRKVSSLGRVC